MGDLTFRNQVLLCHLTHRPKHTLNAVIHIADPPVREISELRERDSSVGTLDCLPPELIFKILNSLDARSVACFARSCYRSNIIARSLPSYSDIVKYAPNALLALRKVGLIGTYSVARLHRVLRSEKCARCSAFGAFLYLPRAMRCCYPCLRHNRSFQTLPDAHIKEYFDLSTEDIEHLPTLQPIPGQYNPINIPTPQSRSLMSVRAARKVGIKKHGSLAQMGMSVVTKFRWDNTVLSRILYYQGNLKNSPRVNREPSIFSGLAAVQFPSVSKSGKVEKGLWCKGCEYNFFLYKKRRLPQSALNELLIQNLERFGPEASLGARAHEAMSSKSFFKHIKRCYGARKLASMSCHRIDDQY
ncbi:F-box domain-containing protein [Nemania sp. FL0916]|nr:F-box domain-containing protein [Nemania sp. FL0916]